MSIVIECYGCGKDKSFEGPDYLPGIVDPWHCEDCKEKKN